MSDEDAGDSADTSTASRDALEDVTNTSTAEAKCDGCLRRASAHDDDGVGAVEEFILVDHGDDDVHGSEVNGDPVYYCSMRCFAYNRSENECLKKASGDCALCGDDGHIMEECPVTLCAGCWRCAAVDHMYSDCPEPKKPMTECFYCGKAGHNEADCPDERPSTGSCNICQEEGHKARDCPAASVNKICNNCDEPEGEDHTTATCPNRRKIYRDLIWGAQLGQAWQDIIVAADGGDMDVVREAIELCTDAIPYVTYVDLELAFREMDVKLYLIAVEQKVVRICTTIDLQGEVDRKYVVWFRFGPNPRGAYEAARWPRSVEENLERLEDAGVVTLLLDIRCSRCGLLGHYRKHCPGTPPAIPESIVDCSNCGEVGHGYRDCIKPRVFVAKGAAGSGDDRGRVSAAESQDEAPPKASTRLMSQTDLTGSGLDSSFASESTHGTDSDWDPWGIRATVGVVDETTGTDRNPYSTGSARIRSGRSSLTPGPKLKPLFYDDGKNRHLGVAVDSDAISSTEVPDTSVGEENEIPSAGGPGGGSSYPGQNEPVKKTQPRVPSYVYKPPRGPVVAPRQVKPAAAPAIGQKVLRSADKGKAVAANTQVVAAGGSVRGRPRSDSIFKPPVPGYLAVPTQETLDSMRRRGSNDSTAVSGRVKPVAKAVIPPQAAAPARKISDLPFRNMEYQWTPPPRGADVLSHGKATESAVDDVIGPAHKAIAVATSTQVVAPGGSPGGRARAESILKPLVPTHLAVPASENMASRKLPGSEGVAPAAASAKSVAEALVAPHIAASSRPLSDLPFRNMEYQRTPPPHGAEVFSGGKATEPAVVDADDVGSADEVTAVAASSLIFAPAGRVAGRARSHSILKPLVPMHLADPVQETLASMKLPDADDSDSSSDDVSVVSEASVAPYVATSSRPLSDLPFRNMDYQRTPPPRGAEVSSDGKAIESAVDDVIGSADNVISVAANAQAFAPGGSDGGRARAQSILNPFMPAHLAMPTSATLASMKLPDSDDVSPTSGRTNTVAKAFGAAHDGTPSSPNSDLPFRNMEFLERTPPPPGAEVFFDGQASESAIVDDDTPTASPKLPQVDESL